MLLSRRSLLVLSLLVAGLSSFAGSTTALPLAGHGSPHGKIVVANRGSGDISVIDVETDHVRTVPMPAGTNPPEPMYVVYTRAGKHVFVGDRANDRVVAFDSRTFAVVGTVPAGAGVFHMWADPTERQLWVNNDIDNTSTVFEPRTLAVLATVPMPADLVAMGGKPHDVVLDLRFAYVTMVGFAGPNDYVIKFDLHTFAEVGRAAVGKDAHVSLTLRNRKLYVPCQNSDTVYVLNRYTMGELTQLPVPGAHGAGMASNGKDFYVTNLTGGGPEGLWIIATPTDTLVGGGVDTPFATPHNIALTPGPRKLYLTHSGATSDQVSIYDITMPDAVPSHVRNVTVGTNPFGLAFVR